MAFLNWEPSLSVKIDSIDNQHKKLIELISDFYKQVNSRSNEEIISQLISGMKEYTIMHFQTEEKYMELFNYPGFIPHKKEHDEFVSKVSDLEERFNAGKVILSFEITDFLKKWIQNHIMGMDMLYSNFFIRHGVK
jgi:hemerythrin